MQQGSFHPPSSANQEGACGQHQPDAPAQNPNLRPQTAQFLPHGTVDSLVRGPLRHEVASTCGPVHAARQDSRQHPAHGGHQDLIGVRDAERQHTTAGPFRSGQSQQGLDQQYFYDQHKRMLSTQQQQSASQPRGQLVEENPERFKKYRIESEMPAKALHQLLHELEKNQLIKQQEVLRRAHALAAQQQGQGSPDERRQLTAASPQPGSTPAPPTSSSPTPGRMPSSVNAGGPHWLPSQRSRDTPSPGGFSSGLTVTTPWPSDSPSCGEPGEADPSTEQQNIAARASAHLRSLPKAEETGEVDGCNPSATAGGAVPQNGATSLTHAPQQQGAGPDNDSAGSVWGASSTGSGGGGAGVPSSDVSASASHGRGAGHPSYEKQMELLLKLLKTPRGSLAIQQLVDAGRVKQDLLQAAIEKHRRQQEQQPHGDGSLPSVSSGPGATTHAGRSAVQPVDGVVRFHVGRNSEQSLPHSSQGPTAVECVGGGDAPYAALGVGPTTSSASGQSLASSLDRRAPDVHQAKRMRVGTEANSGTASHEDAPDCEGLPASGSTGDDRVSKQSAPAGRPVAPSGGGAENELRTGSDGSEAQRKQLEAGDEEQSGLRGQRSENDTGSSRATPLESGTSPAQRTEAGAGRAAAFPLANGALGAASSLVDPRATRTASTAAGTQRAPNGTSGGRSGGKGGAPASFAEALAGGGGSQVYKTTAHARGGAPTHSALGLLSGAGDVPGQAKTQRPGFMRMMRTLLLRPQETRQAEPDMWGGREAAVALEVTTACPPPHGGSYSPGVSSNHLLGGARFSSWLVAAPESGSNAWRLVGQKRLAAGAIGPLHDAPAQAVSIGGCDDIGQAAGVGRRGLSRMEDQQALALRSGQLSAQLRGLDSQVALVGRAAGWFPVPTAPTGCYKPLTRVNGRLNFKYYADVAGGGNAGAGTLTPSVSAAGRVDCLAARRRLGRLDGHIQRLLDSAVRRLSGVYGRRFLLRDEKAIGDAIKQALKDRLRAMAPSLSALSEYRVDRLFQRLSVESGQSEDGPRGHTGNGFDFSGSGMGDDVFAAPLQGSDATSKYSGSSLWVGEEHPESGGLEKAGADTSPHFLHRFVVRQDVEGLQAFFLQKESDRQLVERLRKLQESQRRNRGSRARHRAGAPGADTGGVGGMATRDDLHKDGPGDGGDNFTALFGGPTSGTTAAADGAPGRSDWPSVFSRSFGPLGSPQWKTRKAEQQRTIAQLRRNVAAAEAKAVEFAKVAHSQRCLLLKVTALDFRAFLQTRTAASLFPVQFRMRQLQLIEALHFDLQAPLARVARSLLVAPPPSRASLQNAPGLSGSSSPAPALSSGATSSSSTATAARAAAAAGGARGSSVTFASHHVGFAVGAGSAQTAAPPPAAGVNAVTNPCGVSSTGSVPAGEAVQAETRDGQPQTLHTGDASQVTKYEWRADGGNSQRQQSQGLVEVPPVAGGSKKTTTKSPRVRVRKKTAAVSGATGPIQQAAVSGSHKDGPSAGPNPCRAGNPNATSSRTAVSETGQYATAGNDLSHQNQESSGADGGGVIDSLADLLGSGARAEDFALASSSIRGDERPKAGAEGIQESGAAGHKRGGVAGGSISAGTVKKGSTSQGDVSYGFGAVGSGSGSKGNIGKVSTAGRHPSADRYDNAGRADRDGTVTEPTNNREAAAAAPFFLRPWGGGSAPEEQTADEFGGAAGGVVIPDLDGEGEDEFI
ncbi:hypothetical protein BESB_008890 [Besnoitia besnoiti]|uniref:Uncharacterized protein n=1 Tax=Besnoitia besnoiti TaxID=94643 RepID=A0A2A9MQL2_BESBE|nr:hypothetical protein BESB_008890 [Besnoitia besnoiti]PFH38547.1 hypothetical protein BESB_008890 [Besnoitia besnoiti]